MTTDKDDFLDLLSLEDEVQEKKEDIPDEKPETLEELSDDEIQNVAITEILRTIGFNNAVIEEMKDMVLMGADSEFALAFSSISKAIGLIM